MTDEVRIALQFKHESQEFFDGTFVATEMSWLARSAKSC